MTGRNAGLFPNIPRDEATRAQSIQALIESVEIITGARRSSLGPRLLTTDDLPGMGFTIDNDTGGVVGGPGYEIQTPHAPVGLTASGGFTAINVTWDAPSYTGHAYAIIYRADVDDFGQAVAVAQDTGRFHNDNVPPGTTWYYWARFVNENNVAGPLNDTAGTVGTTHLLVSDIIEQTNDLLDEDDLTPGLNVRLDAFADLTDVTDLAATTEARIVGVETTYDAQFVVVGGDISALQTQLQALVAATGGIWYVQDAEPVIDFTATRHWIDTDDDNKHWVTVKTGTASPDVPANWEWKDVSDTRVDAALSLIATEQTARIDGDNAIAGDVTALTTRVTDAETNISAGAAATSALDSRVTSAEGNIISQASDITTLQSDLTTLDGTVTGVAGALTTLTGRVDTAEGDITAVTQSVATLTATVGTNTADISTIQTTIADLDTESLAQEITRIEAKFDDQRLLQDVVDTAGQVATEATRQQATTQINTEATARADADSALSSLITSLDATLTTAVSDIATLTGRASVLEAWQAQVISDVDGTLLASSTRISSIESSVTAAESGITTLEGRADVTEAWQATVTLDPDGTILANSARVSGMESTLYAPTTGIQGRTGALETWQTSVTADPDGTILASSGRLSSLETEVPALSARATSLEAFQTSATTDPDGTLLVNSSRVGTLESQVADPATGLLQRATVLEEFETSAGDYLAANYSISTLVDTGSNIRVTGMKLLNDPTELSKIIFNADVFAIAPSFSDDTNDSGKAVFTVGPYLDGQGNEQTGVVMDNAVIQLASIETAHIQDISASKITLTGTAEEGGASTIADVIIGDGHIDNAKIGSEITSDNWNAINQGWGIFKSGLGVFHNIYARGNIEATSMSALAINAIQTLNLADNAVTVPLYATSSLLIGTGGPQLALNPSFVLATAGRIFVAVSINQGYGSGQRDWGLRVRHVQSGTWLVDRPAMEEVNDMPCWMGSVMGVTGTNTFEIYWVGENSGIQGTVSAFIQGAMK